MWTFLLSQKQLLALQLFLCLDEILSRSLSTTTKVVQIHLERVFVVDHFLKMRIFHFQLWCALTCDKITNLFFSLLFTTSSATFSCDLTDTDSICNAQCSHLRSSTAFLEERSRVSSTTRCLAEKARVERRMGEGLWNQKASEYAEISVGDYFASSFQSNYASWNFYAFCAELIMRRGFLRACGKD